MATILSIETSTEVCSVCLSSSTQIIGIRETDISNSHSSMLAVFIDELMKEHNIEYNSIDAVAVSKGPGSYTGLRIGVSTAKAICYAQNIPLIGVNTLKALASGFLQDYTPGSESLLCPMIDARRMEVYAAIFDSKLNCIKKTKPEIITEESFVEYHKNKEMILFGTGAEKCKEVLVQDNIKIISDFKASSKHLISEAYSLYTQNKFEDIAYFEPFYLKEFMATTPKKKVF